MFWNRIIGPSNDGCVQASIFAHSGQVWRTIAGYEAIQNDPQRPSVPECDGCEGLSVAWLVAREETGQRTTYRTESGREALLKNPDFVAASWPARSATTLNRGRRLPHRSQTTVAQALIGHDSEEVHSDYITVGREALRHAVHKFPAL